MICLATVKKFCKDDVSLIENYDKAIADNNQTWDCHHKNEIRILPSGMIELRSIAELKENNRYFNCPANELIFLTRSAHSKLHKKFPPESLLKFYASGYMKGYRHSLETKQLISEKSKTAYKNKSDSEISEINMKISDKLTKYANTSLGKFNLSKATKGKTWYNNGVINKRCSECPVGFVKGRLPFRKSLQFTT